MGREARALADPPTLRIYLVYLLSTRWWGGETPPTPATPPNPATDEETRPGPTASKLQSQDELPSLPCPSSSWRGPCLDLGKGCRGRVTLFHRLGMTPGEIGLSPFLQSGPENPE